ncbi:MAG: hypothetical protein H6606_01910 [Flavobacteriales bacterium]|nr:hypothetical protein [Flavobacteriales bacterium]
MTTKRTILLIAVLLTGFAAGFLVAGRLAKKRIDRIVERHEPRSMPHRMLQLLQPDESQLPEVDRILHRYADTLRNLRRTHRRDLKQVHLAMQEELRPLLHEDQIKRLERMQKRMMRPPREKKDARRE